MYWYIVGHLIGAGIFYTILNLSWDTMHYSIGANILYTVSNSELGYHVLSKIQAGVLCTILRHVLVYSRLKFGTVAQDLGLMSPFSSFQQRLRYVPVYARGPNSGT